MGAGVTLTLPWLESFPRAVGPKSARAAGVDQKRFVNLFMPHGAAASWGEVTGDERSIQLAEIQLELDGLQSKMLMLRMVANFTWQRDLLQRRDWDKNRTSNEFNICTTCVSPTGAFVTPTHSRAAAAYANCVDGDAWRVERGYSRDTSPKNPQSFDQLVAAQLGGATQIDSLQLGLFNGDGGLDERHSNLSRELSYDENGDVRNKLLDPRAVFDAIVGATDPRDKALAERRRALDLSALDAVSESIASLQPRLSQGDRQRLEQFLTSTRELEQRISQVVPALSCDDVGVAPPSTLWIPGELGFSGTAPEVSLETMWRRATAMNDLVVMALQCDVTRLITYMLDNSRSDLNYSWLHNPDGSRVAAWHAETHVESPDYASNPPGFRAITSWMCRVVADLVRKLDAVPDGERTLLDNSVVLFGSDVHNADHAMFDLPLIIFGSGGGVFKQNALIKFTESIPDMRQLRDLYFTLLHQYFAIPVTSFGDDVRGVQNALMTELLA
jgi:hypothetical protein